MGGRTSGAALAPSVILTLLFLLPRTIQLTHIPFFFPMQVPFLSTLEERAWKESFCGASDGPKMVILGGRSRADPFGSGVARRSYSTFYTIASGYECHFARVGSFVL
jgi:hypothetical protein